MKTIKAADKQKALAALLDTSTFTAAAEQAGLSRRTLYSYLRDDKDFAMSYKQQRQLRELEAAERAAALHQDALDAIRDVMVNGESGMVRLKAAERLLAIADDGISTQRRIAGDLWDIHTGLSFDVP